MRLFSDDIPRLPALRNRFRDLGYTEETVARILGIPEVTDIRLDHYPVYRRRLASDVPLHDLIRLAVLQDALPADRIRSLFPEEAFAVLEATGVLVAGGEKAGRFGVSFYPCLDHLFATDHRFRTPLGDADEPPVEPVMYLGPDSYLLARTTIRDEVERALDLCTGSGVQAILAARHAPQVTAIDLNPRAVLFTQFNAALNGVADRVLAAEGDLYGAEAVSGHYDLITANPPFVPNPNPSLAYRDETGQVLEQIVGGLKARLTRTGRAQIVTTLIRRRGRLPSDPIEKWRARQDLNILFLNVGTDPASGYVVAHNRRPFGQKWDDYVKETDTWLNAYERAGIEAVAGGVLIAAPNRHPNGAPWIVEQAGRMPKGPVGEAIGSYFQCLERVRPLLFIEEIWDRVPEPAEGAELQSQVDLADPDRRVKTHLGSPAVTARGVFALTSDVADLVFHMDGKRTVAEIVQKTAEIQSREPEEVAPEIFPVLLELAERGFVRI